MSHSASKKSSAQKRKEPSNELHDKEAEELDHKTK